MSRAPPRHPKNKANNENVRNKELPRSQWGGGGALAKSSDNCRADASSKCSSLLTVGHVRRMSLEILRGKAGRSCSVTHPRQFLRLGSKKASSFAGCFFKKR